MTDEKRYTLLQLDTTGWNILHDVDDVVAFLEVQGYAPKTYFPPSWLSDQSEQCTLDHVIIPGG